MRRGSRESDQNKRPVRLKGGCINWWSWFQLYIWREDIGGKEWRVKVARKDESRFTILVHKYTIILKVFVPAREMGNHWDTHYLSFNDGREFLL